MNSNYTTAQQHTDLETFT